MTFAPRYISSMIRATLTSRRRTLLAARMPAYFIPRCICGRTPDLRVRRAWKSSFMNSPRNSVNERRYPVGLKKNDMKALLSPMPPPSALIAAVVRYDRVASPVRRLQMLAPLFDRRPSPFEMRDAMRVASTGLLDAIRCWRSRSYQRNAGIPSLLPCRIPAWLPDVIDGRIASHLESLWLPSRTQFAIVLTEPARIRPARIGWASPSIWRITRPGLSVWPVDLLTSSRWTSRP